MKPSLALWHMVPFSKALPHVVAPPAGHEAWNRPFGQKIEKTVVGVSPQEIPGAKRLGAGGDKETLSGTHPDGTKVIISRPAGYTEISNPSQQNQSIQEEIHALGALGHLGVTPKLYGVHQTGYEDTHHVTEDLNPTHVSLGTPATPTQGYIPHITDHNHLAAGIPRAFESLAKIHGAGYAHGDTQSKPEHVWMPKDPSDLGQTKFIDFGNVREATKGERAVDTQGLLQTFYEHLQHVGALNLAGTTTDRVAPEHQALFQKIADMHRNQEKTPEASEIAATLKPLTGVAKRQPTASEPTPQPAAQPAAQPRQTKYYPPRESVELWNGLHDHKDAWEAWQKNPDAATKEKFDKARAAQTELLAKHKDTHLGKLFEQYAKLNDRAQRGEKLSQEETNRHGDIAYDIIHHIIGSEQEVGRRYPTDAALHQALRSIAPTGAAFERAKPPVTKAFQSPFPYAIYPHEATLKKSNVDVPALVHKVIRAGHDHVASVMRAAAAGKDDAPAIRQKKAAHDAAHAELEAAMKTTSHPLLDMIQKDRDLNAELDRKKKEFNDNWPNTKAGMPLKNERNANREAFANALGLSTIPKHMAPYFPLNRPWHHEVMEACHPGVQSLTLKRASEGYLGRP